MVVESPLARGSSTLTLLTRFPGHVIDPPIIVKGLVDKLAETEDDLMFLRNERIELIADLGNGTYLVRFFFFFFFLKLFIANCNHLPKYGDFFNLPLYFILF